MPNIDDEIRSKTEAFAADLAVLVRRVALESVSAALGGTTVATPVLVAVKRGPGRPKKVVAAAPVPEIPAKRGPGRPRKVVAPAPIAKAQPAKAPAKAPAAKAPVSKKPVAVKRAPGAKRPPAEIAKLTEQLGEYIKVHPGVRMEALSHALGTPAKDLRFPVVKLVRAKKVRTEGQKQNMAYFPA
jgi:hypothetical protein